MTGPDLLAPAADTRLVSAAYLGAALRRRREMIATLAVVGALVGFAFGFLAPSKTASTTVLLRFPTGSDPSHAMATDLSLLTTRAVAQAALTSLHSEDTPRDLLAQYHGTILSDGVMLIAAKGRDAATATRRANAVAAAFLDFRAQLSRQQVDAVAVALRAQEATLREQAASVSAQIAAFDANAAPGGTPLDDLVNARAGLDVQIQQIENTIATNAVSAASAARTSRVIDPATTNDRSGRKAAALDMVSGLVVGLVLGSGGVVLFAIVTTRVSRRSDIVAAMRAPVVVSVGSVVPRWWQRLFQRMPTPDEPNADLQLIVGHLQSTLAIASTSALVVVSIDSLLVTALAVRALEHRLVADGQRVAIVNESGRDLPIEGPPELQRKDEHDDTLPADVVLVLAVLDPAQGAEQLREWAANAVAFVTAGRSTEAKLEANATMIRSASLDLHSVVLLDADRADDTLGIFEDPSVSTARHGAVEQSSESTVGSS